VTADLSNISGTLEKKYGPRGVYWKLGFEIGIFFGGTELAARLYWKDKWVSWLTYMLFVLVTNFSSPW